MTFDLPFSLQLFCERVNSWVVVIHETPDAATQFSEPRIKNLISYRTRYSFKTEIGEIERLLAGDEFRNLWGFPLACTALNSFLR